MNIVAEWWARFVEHKFRENEQAAAEVKKRLGPAEQPPQAPKADRKL